MKSKVKAGVLSLALVLGMMSVASTAFAETSLIEYSGTGIWDKASVNTADIYSTKTCSVRHTQRRTTGAEYGMTVSVQRSNGDFFDTYSTVGSRTFYNDVSGQTFSTSCSAGKYRLYFKTTLEHYSFNISGSFYY